LALARESTTPLSREFGGGHSETITGEDDDSQGRRPHMRKPFLVLATSTVLLASSSLAWAIDIGGLDVPLGPTFASSQIYENTLTGVVGQELTGFGKVDSINSMAVGTLCVNCELTYQFGGYVVTAISPTEVKFTGGWVKFYLGFGADNDFNTTTAGSSAAALSQATNGTLFLSLMGHAVDAAGNTFVGTGVGIGSSLPAGHGDGLADVDNAAGGIANVYFDTNAVPALFGGNADILLTSAFNGLFPPFPSECVSGAGPACVSGSANFRGNVVANIPEPGTYALMLAGVGVVGFVARRRKG